MENLENIQYTQDSRGNEFYMKSKFTILIIDDDPNSIKILIDVLQKKYEVMIATSGQRGLDIARNDPTIDLILLDIIMPIMDGYDVINHLNLGNKTKDIPVIFLTSKDGYYDDVIGLNLGAMDYITKPVSKTRLLAKINAHIFKRKNSEQQANHYAERAMDEFYPIGYGEKRKK
jgi:putative two-component system response regulator